MDETWNERYASEEYIYGTEANEYLKEKLQSLAAGKILLPAEGEGRNAVYAATLGWDVFAFDQSTVGREKALKLAATKNVTITYDIAEFEDADYPEHSFDALALIYAHVPFQLRAQYYSKLFSFLKPGGMLILEGFSKEQTKFNSGGPRDASMLFSESELKEILSDMNILELATIETTLQEGNYHEGKASVVRLFAKNK
ncbi:MAG: class I SAM-dependent methyltransferase [Bacteroidota bacterium]